MNKAHVYICVKEKYNFLLSLKHTTNHLWISFALFVYTIHKNCIILEYEGSTSVHYRACRPSEGAGLRVVSSPPPAAVLNTDVGDQGQAARRAGPVLQGPEHHTPASSRSKPNTFPFPFVIMDLIGMPKQCRRAKHKLNETRC